MKTSKVVFGLALALGITATAFASTVDVSPVDKESSQDSAGKIYASGGGRNSGYFWTNLGYAQITDSNGNPVELYTPFIYHTNDKTWDSTNSKYNPVHDGDDSEMDCRETMGQIYVGEFDRIIKALYHNDLKVYNSINGGIDQDTGEKIDGLRQKAITKINRTNINEYTTKYDYLNDEDVVIGTTYDYDNRMTLFEMNFDKANNKLSYNVENTHMSFSDTIDGIASTDYVDQKFSEIPSVTDTNTKNESLKADLSNDGTLTVSVKDSDGTTITGSVDNVASKSYVDTRITEVLSDLPEYEDTNTVTTISGDSWINADELTSDTGDKHYNLSFNEDKLKDFVQANSKDTITTVKGSGLATVTDDGNHNYTVDVSEDKVKEIAKSVDTNTKISSITNDRDSDKGIATITINDTDGNTFSTEIKDVASHEELKSFKTSTDTEITNIKNTHNEYVTYNEGDKNIMKQEIVNNSYRISGLENKVSKLDSQVKETGAMSAALAGLHPRFTDGNKGEWLMSMGHYKGKTAYATGVAYAPDERVMFTMGGSTVGGGDYMFNIGATFALDRVDKNKDIRYSRREVDQIVAEVKAENAELKLRLARLEALLVK